MPKDPSPLLGYNNNIKHKNRVFHVQTEDSGVKHPHIITHLFMDGGRILKSIKKSYAEYLGVEKMADLVRQMMKDQHKGMLIALRDGQFDQLLEDADAPRQAKAAPASKPPEPPKVALPSRPPPAATTKRASTRPPPAYKPVESRAHAEDEGPPTTRMPPEGVDDAISLDSELDALEEAASDIAPAFEPQNDLPPPPANLFRPREPGSGGGYRTLTPVPEAPLQASRPPPPSRRQPSNRAPRPRTPEPSRAEPSRPPTGRAEPSRPPSSRSDPRAERAERPAARPPLARPPAPAASRPPLQGGRPPTGGDPRYAPARPAVIFGQAGPKSGSIFGEDLISDKSLDEVILSYLAEDLESPAGDAKKKKK